MNYLGPAMPCDAEVDAYAASSSALEHISSAAETPTMTAAGPATVSAADTTQGVAPPPGTQLPVDEDIMSPQVPPGCVRYMGPSSAAPPPPPVDGYDVVPYSDGCDSLAWHCCLQVES